MPRRTKRITKLIGRMIFLTLSLLLVVNCESARREDFNGCTLPAGASHDHQLFWRQVRFFARLCVGIFREISDLDERQSMLKMLHARGGLYEAIFSDASAL